MISELRGNTSTEAVLSGTAGNQRIREDECENIGGQNAEMCDLDEVWI
jgi:hypothetical protein